jgi:hypothetical protein
MNNIQITIIPFFNHSSKSTQIQIELNPCTPKSSPSIHLYWPTLTPYVIQTPPPPFPRIQDPPTPTTHLSLKQNHPATNSRYWDIARVKHNRTNVQTGNSHTAIIQHVSTKSYIFWSKLLVRIPTRYACISYPSIITTDELSKTTICYI